MLPPQFGDFTFANALWTIEHAYSCCISSIKAKPERIPEYLICFEG